MASLVEGAWLLRVEGGALITRRFARRWDITALLNAAAQPGAIADRHTWLVRLMQWLRESPRGAETGSPTPNATHPALTRLRHLLNVLEQNDEPRRHVQALLCDFWRDIDAMTLLADYGLGPRVSLRSELSNRLSERLLPASPESDDLATVFRLVFEPNDDAWVAAIDEATMARVVALMAPAQTVPVAAPVSAPGAAPASGRTSAGQAGPRQTPAVLHDAMSALAAAITADGLSGRLRRRMDTSLVADEPFRKLGASVDRLRELVLQGDAAAALQEATYLRALIDACRRATDSVRDHLEEHGVSVDIVFACEQVHERATRLETLMDVSVAPHAPVAWQRLVVHLLRDVLQRRGVMALVQRQTQQLARSVAERNAEVGEHYITRDRAQWRDMLWRAMGGGVAVGGTTVLKYAVASLALLPFWDGVLNSANYAASFVLIMLLHWTLATKQPAMTAPALAAKADAVATEAGLREFVDAVAQLIRSQVAGVIGNLAAVVPVVLLVQAASTWLAGQPLISAEHTAKTLPSLSLWGPTVLFAAFTGVLLFASSVFAGWVENWFVFRRLDSAIAWNPRVVAALGNARAMRWSRWWRHNISGLAGNVALGFMLGLVPVVLAFVGLGLEARHVTLSTGQIAAAVGARGVAVLGDPALWWAVAAIPFIGALNLMVSFSLAYTLALRARGVRVKDRQRIRAAIWQRFVTRPLSFLLPPREPTP